MQEKHKKKMETLGVGNKYNNQPKVNISFLPMYIVLHRILDWTITS